MGTGVCRLGALDGFPASTICWWNPSQPSFISQCEPPGADYIALRDLSGNDSPGPQGWESQHCISFFKRMKMLW
eukprot:11157785-Lingulodinium_polyedra.AAC.1